MGPPVAVSTGFDMKPCKFSFFLRAWEIEPAAPKPTQPVQPPKTKETRKMKNLLTTKSGSQKRLPKMESPTISFQFLLVKKFDSHFGSQKTTTKNRSRKTAHFSKFCHGLNEFLPTSNGTCSHSHDFFCSLLLECDLLAKKVPGGTPYSQHNIIRNWT